MINILIRVSQNNIMVKVSSLLIKIFFVWTIISTSYITLMILFAVQDPVIRAFVGMGVGLVVIWVFIFGSIMFRFRNNIRNR